MIPYFTPQDGLGGGNKGDVKFYIQKMHFLSLTFRKVHSTHNGCCFHKQRWHPHTVTILFTNTFQNDSHTAATWWQHRSWVTEISHKTKLAVYS